MVEDTVTKENKYQYPSESEEIIMQQPMQQCLCLPSLSVRKKVKRKGKGFQSNTKNDDSSGNSTAATTTFSEQKQEKNESKRDEKENGKRSIELQAFRLTPNNSNNSSNSNEIGPSPAFFNNDETFHTCRGEELLEEEGNHKYDDIPLAFNYTETKFEEAEERKEERREHHDNNGENNMKNKKETGGAGGTSQGTVFFGLMNSILTPRSPMQMLMKSPAAKTEEKVEKLVDPPQYLIDHYKGNIQEAKTKFNEILRWRKENNVDNILNQLPPYYDLVAKYFRIEFFDCDHSGSLLVYEESYAPTNFDEIIEAGVVPKDFVNVMVFRLEYYAKVVKNDPTGIGYPHSHINIMDANKLNSGLRNDKRKHPYQKAVMDTLARYYPTRQVKTLIVNASRYHSYVFPLARFILNPEIAKVIKFIPKGSEELQTFANPNTIPTELGGTWDNSKKKYKNEKADIDADAEENDLVVRKQTMEKEEVYYITQNELQEETNEYEYERRFQKLEIDRIEFVENLRKKNSQFNHVFKKAVGR